MALNQQLLPESEKEVLVPYIDDGNRAAGIGQAAWILEDALLGESLVSDYPRSEEARKLYFQCARANQCYIRCITLMFILSMFETPSWCSSSWAEGHFWIYEDSASRCLKSMDPSFYQMPFEKQKEAEKYMFSGVPYLPPGWGLVIETILLYFIAKKTYLEWKLQTTHFDALCVTYFNKKITYTVGCMVVLEVCDMIIFFIFRQSFRTLWLSRFVFMVCVPSVGMLFFSIKAVVMEFVTIAVFFIAGVIMSAWIATMLLQDMKEGCIDEKTGCTKMLYVFTSGIPEEAEERDELAVNRGFNQIMSAVKSMFIAGATDDFYEVFRNTYSKNRLYGFLWLGFLCLVHVLFLSLVLDTLVSAYTKHNEAMVEKGTKGRAKGMMQAFKVLTAACGGSKEGESESVNERELDQESFIEFANEYGKSPCNMPINQEQAECIFRRIAKTKEEVFEVGQRVRRLKRAVLPSRNRLEVGDLGTVTQVPGRTPGTVAQVRFDAMRGQSPILLNVLSGKIAPAEGGKMVVDLKGFVEVCGLMRYNIWFTIRDSPVKDQFPSIWNSGWFQKLYEWTQEEGETESALNQFMNAVLGVNLILVVAELAFEFQANGEKEENKLGIPNLELMFSFIYLLEVGIKLCVWSWAEYTASNTNIFDFTATILLLGSSGASLLDMVTSSSSSTNDSSPPTGSSQSVKKVLNMLRLLRLVRVVKQLKKFPAVQFMIGTIIKLVKQAKPILALLLVVVYFFTTLGVQIFGGVLWKGRKELEETEWKEEEYYVLNFNDWLNSFGCWVVLLLTEYKHGFTQAIKAVGPKGSFIVFPLFYLLAVSIVFELVKAYTIEVFVELHKEYHEEQVEESKEKKELKHEKEQRIKELDRIGLQRLSMKFTEPKNQTLSMWGKIQEAFNLGGEDELQELKKEHKIYEVELDDDKFKFNGKKLEEKEREKLLEFEKELTEQVEEEDPMKELEAEYEEQGMSLHTDKEPSKDMEEIKEALDGMECVGREYMLKMTHGQQQPIKVQVLDYDVSEELLPWRVAYLNDADKMTYLNGDDFLEDPIAKLNQQMRREKNYGDKQEETEE